MCAPLSGWVRHNVDKDGNQPSRSLASIVGFRHNDGSISALTINGYDFSFVAIKKNQ